MRHVAAAVVAAMGASMHIDARADGPEGAVEAYFHAVDHARSAELPRAFHPSAMMYWVAADGALATLSQPEWRARLDAAKAPAPAQERKVGDVIVDGDAALAFATARFPTYAFQDALLLRRVDNGWRIVGKVFHRREPPDRPPADAATRAREEAAVRALVSRLYGGTTAEVYLLETVAAARVRRERGAAHLLLVKIAGAWRVVGVSE